ncbi:GGDEF domain-containing protein [Sphingosinicella soli]|uniref:diguanylate cyclase n=1 Tax=Sphingosinicella soli TaxID=333708 RepID=A0A7W7F5V1_9SPHN|nr:diguanylate cyclase [Sphingosinicella soli]MBB4631835.1 diguanylate cyclase (GGDEF)-like protein [Sphingosinicella soli]
MNRVIAFVFLVLIAALAGGEARADARYCHAVTDLSAAKPGAFACSGTPADYHQRSLWLKIEVPTDSRIVYVHQTRFDRLTALFVYEDGHTAAQTVRRGNYGAHWRLGGQIAFEPPVLAAPVKTVMLRFDGLASHELLRIRLPGADEANAQAAALPVIVGGTIALLTLGALYTLSVGIALRREYLLWHGLWAVTMVVWGLLWSQLALVAAPGIAGWSSQICTFLACLAVTLATVSGVKALGETMGPRALRFGTLMLGFLMIPIGIMVALETGAALGWQRTALGVLTLSVLALVTYSLVKGCRAGNADAKALAWAWAVPMVTLALTQIVDMDPWVFGGGPQVVMLIAAALQTVWLSIAVTIRIAHLREERDRARAAEARMSELASRDALTGLLNRRGFVDRAEFMIEARSSPEEHFGLLLIDVDHFKRVNDTYGHETGDAVLCRIARRLERWEGPLCVSGRIGGEEFVLGITGLTPIGIRQFAESVRRGIADQHHPELRIGHVVTVSIGVASADRALGFQRLYGWADQELYRAKASGRNRVAFHTGDRMPQAATG